MRSIIISLLTCLAMAFLLSKIDEEIYNFFVERFYIFLIGTIAGLNAMDISKLENNIK